MRRPGSWAVAPAREPSAAQSRGKAGARGAAPRTDSDPIRSLSGLVFNRSAYAPHGDGGKRLPAHPLIHVVQQVRPDMAIQRAPSAGAEPPMPAGTPQADPLDDDRTEWVDALPMGVRSSIDNIGDSLGLPMPQTSVGFSARGDHLHDKSKRKRKSQGMLAHAMGVAIDYFAYKNVHLTDARLRAVLEALTERVPNMQLPEGALRTIVQSGEAKKRKGDVDEDLRTRLDGARAKLDTASESLAKGPFPPDAGPIGRRFQTLRSPQHLDRTLPRTS